MSHNSQGIPSDSVIKQKTQTHLLCPRELLKISKNAGAEQDPLFLFSLSSVAMAEEEQELLQEKNEEVKKLLSSYMGVGFSVFLALLPKNSVPLLQKLRGEVLRAEEEVRVMRRRRQEDSKANARVVEIFASHRNAWQAEEKRLLNQIDAAAEEIATLRERVAEVEKVKGRVEELEREVRERDEMISFMSRRTVEEEEGLGGCRSRECYGVGVGKSREWVRKEEEDEVECEMGSNRNVEVVYEHQQTYQHHQELGNGFDSEFMASASKFWPEKSSLWQV